GEMAPQRPEQGGGDPEGRSRHAHALPLQFGRRRRWHGRRRQRRVPDLERRQDHRHLLAIIKPFEERTMAKNGGTKTEKLDRKTASPDRYPFWDWGRKEVAEERQDR